MSTAPAGARTLIRRGLALVVAFDLVQVVFLVRSAKGVYESSGRQVEGLLALISALPVSVALSALGLVATARFAVKAGRVRAGFVALVCLGVLVAVHGELFGSQFHHLYFSGLTLLGWIAGQAYAARRSEPLDESYAYSGALACLGACYFNAGVSKLLYSGAEWISSANLRSVVLAQHGLAEGNGLLAWYRQWVIDSPALALILAAVTVAIEIGGLLLLASPLWRGLTALALLLMHLNILILTEVILYIEAMYLLVLLGFPWRLAAEPSEQESGPPLRLTRWVVVGLTMLALAGMAMNANDERHAGSAVPEATTRVVVRAGPLAAGLTVGGYRVSTVEVSREQAAVRFDAPEALTVFIRCANERLEPARPEDVQLYFEAPAEGEGSAAGEGAERTELSEALTAMLVRQMGERGCQAFRSWMQDSH